MPCPVDSISSPRPDAPVYLLGPTDDGHWRGVIDATLNNNHTAVLPATVQFVDLRSLITALPLPDLAIAGHAVSLATWHQVCMVSFTQQE